MFLFYYKKINSEENYKLRGRFDRIDVITNAVDLSKFFSRTEEEKVKFKSVDGKSLIVLRFF
jgi:hypothetical protein